MWGSCHGNNTSQELTLWYAGRVLEEECRCRLGKLGGVEGEEEKEGKGGTVGQDT